MAITGLPNSGGSGGSGLTESQIKDIILAELINGDSPIYAQSLAVANTIDVVRKVEEALPFTDGYNIVTQISDLTGNIVNDSITGSLAIDGSGVIFNAIGNIITTEYTNGGIADKINTDINSYATSIGVGSDGQPYSTVQDAADAVITSQLLLGGTIDLSIKAGGA